MKVLLTDDSRTIRMILRGLLRELQITDVLEAQNGQECIETLQNNEIDVVFLDIHMPKMSGLDALSFIKETPGLSDLPVVIISSDTDYRQVEKARDLGAFGYIKKPFRLEGLRSAIMAAIKAREQPSEPVAVGGQDQGQHAAVSEEPAGGPTDAHTSAQEVTPQPDPQKVRRKGLLSWLSGFMKRR
jgi:two-component system chemotaxis response regulator CheY